MAAVMGFQQGMGRRAREDRGEEAKIGSVGT